MPLFGTKDRFGAFSFPKGKYRRKNYNYKIRELIKGGIDMNNEAQEKSNIIKELLEKLKRIEEFKEKKHELVPLPEELRIFLELSSPLQIKLIELINQSLKGKNTIIFQIYDGLFERKEIDNLELKYYSIRRISSPFKGIKVNKQGYFQINYSSFYPVIDITDKYITVEGLFLFSGLRPFFRKGMEELSKFLEQRIDFTNSLFMSEEMEELIIIGKLEREKV